MGTLRSSFSAESVHCETGSLPCSFLPVSLGSSAALSSHRVFPGLYKPSQLASGYCLYWSWEEEPDQLGYNIFFNVWFQSALLQFTFFPYLLGIRRRVYFLSLFIKLQYFWKPLFFFSYVLLSLDLITSAVSSFPHCSLGAAFLDLSSFLLHSSRLSPINPH